MGKNHASYLRNRILFRSARASPPNSSPTHDFNFGSKSRTTKYRQKIGESRGADQEFLRGRFGRPDDSQIYFLAIAQPNKYIHPIFFKTINPLLIEQKMLCLRSPLSSLFFLLIIKIFWHFRPRRFSRQDIKIIKYISKKTGKIHKTHTSIYDSRTQHNFIFILQSRSCLSNIRKGLIHSLRKLNIPVKLIVSLPLPTIEGTSFLSNKLN